MVDLKQIILQSLLSASASILNKTFPEHEADPLGNFPETTAYPSHFLPVTVHRLPDVDQQLDSK
jgi:hypothetical protein